MEPNKVKKRKQDALPILKLIEVFDVFSFTSTPIHYNGYCSRPLTFHTNESALLKTRYT